MLFMNVVSFIFHLYVRQMELCINYKEDLFFPFHSACEREIKKYDFSFFPCGKRDLKIIRFFFLSFVSFMTNRLKKYNDKTCFCSFR